MRIVLLGAPGAGKGTQAELLATHLKVPHLVVADLLRDAATAEDELGAQLRLSSEEGGQLSDELTLAAIKQRLQQNDAGKGFIIDGFPRTVAQAEAMDIMLFSMGEALDIVLELDVDLDTLMPRLTGRRVCRSCGMAFNVFSSPPKLDDRCDECGGVLRHRVDDKEETINNRLRIHEAHIHGLEEYFSRQSKLRQIAATTNIKGVFARVKTALEQAKDELREKGSRRKARTDETPATVTPVEKAPAKKAPAKKAPAKKAPAKKAPAKKAPAKKAPAKKAPAKKAPAKKAPAKKAPAKKAPAKKAPAKKAPAKKAPAKKAPAKKAPAKKAPAKKAPAKKAPAKKRK